MRTKNVSFAYFMLQDVCRTVEGAKVSRLLQALHPLCVCRHHRNYFHKLKNFATSRTCASRFVNIVNSVLGMRPTIKNEQ